MDEQEREQVRLMFEVGILRFFDHYLTKVFPKQCKEIVSAHNKDVTAHAPQIKIAVQAESARIRLWLVCLVFAGGLGGGVGVAKLVAAIAGTG